MRLCVALDEANSRVYDCYRSIDSRACHPDPYFQVEHVVELVHTFIASVTRSRSSNNEPWTLYSVDKRHRAKVLLISPQLPKRYLVRPHDSPVDSAGF